ncbi:MAG: hypothetical protein ABR588_02560 [Sphingomicrobium sp.]
MAPGVLGGGLAEPALSLSEVQAFVRVETGEEEALLAGLVRTASALCEAFVNQVVIVRGFSEELSPSGAWQRLSLAPVRSIEGVEAVAADGSAAALPSSAYTIDIDAQGDGWVRVLDTGRVGRVRVNATAGIASGTNEVPEPLRHGILRLVGHLFASRDGGGVGGPGGEPPAAVTALWRPYRRMRLS